MFTQPPKAHIHGYSGPTYPDQIDALTTCFRARGEQGDDLVAKLTPQFDGMCDSITVRKNYTTHDGHTCRAIIFMRVGRVEFAVSVPDDMERCSAVYFRGGDRHDRNQLVADMLKQLDMVRV